MSRVSRGFRITGRIIKFLFFLIVFSVIAIILWRIFSSGDPKSVDTITPNDKLCEAYEEHGDELYMFRQEQRSITSAKDNYGYFSVTNCVFIPEANQIQIVVRYNNSTIRSLAEDKALPEVPLRDEELFDVSLSIATDKTPDNKDDNLGNDENGVRFTRVHPSSVSSDTKNLYNYRRFVFDLDSADISLSELLEDGLMLAVYADIYYVGDVDYEKPAYGTLCLYDHLSENIEVEMRSRDRDALEEFKN